MNDRELDARLRAHFEAIAHANPPPDFDAMLATTHATSGARAPRPWAIAAALLVAIASSLLLRDAPTEPIADSALLAELKATTQWTAPSDALLTGLDGSRFLGLPEFDDMTYRAYEVKPWI